MNKTFIVNRSRTRELASLYFRVPFAVDGFALMIALIILAVFGNLSGVNVPGRQKHGCYLLYLVRNLPQHLQQQNICNGTGFGLASGYGDPIFYQVTQSWKHYDGCHYHIHVCQPPLFFCTNSSSLRQSAPAPLAAAPQRRKAPIPVLFYPYLHVVS